MSFDEIQSIWNSQSLSEDSVDRDAVMAVIQEKNRSFSRIVGVVEIAMILMLLFVAMMFMKDPLLQGHDYVLIVAAMASLIAAGFVWKARCARKQRGVNFEDSLLGIVNKSIADIEGHVSLLQNFFWWFGSPCLLGLIVGLFIIDESKRYLLYTIFIPAFLICMLLTYWQIRREIRMNVLPERERLLRLQSKLESGEQ